MDKAYIDIFFIWIEKEEKLETFSKQSNTFHSDLRFKYEKSMFSVNFVDVEDSLNNNEFETDLFCKSAGCHQFLEFGSLHPFHVTRSSV